MTIRAVADLCVQFTLTALRKVFFGIRNRMLMLIIVLIGLAYFIGELKTATTLRYVVNREKVDLQDESQNRKLAIELSLQEAYAELTSQTLKVEQGDSITLAPSDRTTGVSTAKIMERVSRGSFSQENTLKAIFGEARLKSYEKSDNPEEVLWSSFHWSDGATAWSSSRPQSSSATNAYISILLPVTKLTLARGENVKDAQDANGKLEYFHIRLDVTEMVHELTRGTRSLFCFVSAEGDQYRVTIAPNGRPIDREPVPKPVEQGVVLFKKLYQADADIVRRGTLYCPDNSSWLGRWIDFFHSEGASIKEMFQSDKNVELYFGESNGLGKDAFQLVESTRINQIEYALQQLDPFIRIDPIDHEVGAFRVRAGSAEYLELVENAIASYAHQLGIATKLQWSRVPLDKLVMSVQLVTTPTSMSSNGSDPGLGYIVRCASLNEIRGAAERDLLWLQYTTYGAMLFAIVLGIWVSDRLIKPLARMTRVAQMLSKLGLEPSEDGGKKLEMYLEQLPTEDGTELGVLAVQFATASRDLMQAKRQAEESAENYVSEQRKVEQSEREKAIASEVSQHRVQLLASVSHDMRQPLHVIAHFTERLLKDPALDARSKDRLRTIQKNTTDLDFLVEDILDYKRILAGDVVVNRELVDLEALLNELKTHHTENAKQRNVNLVILNMWNGDFESDRLRLKRVLNNLVSNAVRASQDSDVRLQVSPMGVDAIEISVTDFGCGMDEIQQQLVFQSAERRAQIERQHRSLAKTKDANSTGLGLFISKQLIDAMGGEIRFTSTLGQGTKFVIRLPVKMGSEVNESASKRIDLKSTIPASALTNTLSRSLAPNNASSGLQAVIVDDDPRCTQILAEMVEDMGYQAKQIHDGATAIRVISQSVPDLVTLDVLMPDLDGWEVLRRLKANPKTESVPVVMVTVNPDQAKATLLGANGFVSKPIDESKLTGAIVDAIGSGHDATVLVVDDEPQCLLEMEELLLPFGCRILKAKDGVDALKQIELLNGTPLDLAIVDLYMPNMDGFALIEKLGQMPATRNVPVVVVTAGVLTDREQANLQPRVADFFRKGSLDLKTFRGEILRLIKRRADPGKKSDNRLSKETK